VGENWKEVHYIHSMPHDNIIPFSITYDVAPPNPNPLCLIMRQVFLTTVLLNIISHLTGFFSHDLKYLLNA